jgi:uncharacterized membrane protein
MSQQAYKTLADVTFWFHWVWVAIIVAGGFMAAFCEWYRTIHAAIVAMTISAQVAFLGCPLVALESYLRRQYGDCENFNGSFVCYGLEKYFNITIHPGAITVALIVIAVIAAILVTRKWF